MHPASHGYSINHTPKAALSHQDGMRATTPLLPIQHQHKLTLSLHLPQLLSWEFTESIMNIILLPLHQLSLPLIIPEPHQTPV